MWHWLTEHGFDAESVIKIGVIIALAIIVHVIVRWGVRRLVLLSQKTALERAAAEEQSTSDRVAAVVSNVLTSIVPGFGGADSDAATAAPGGAGAGEKVARKGRRRRAAAGSFAAGRSVQRAATLCQGIGVVVDVALVFTALVMILNQFHIAIEPLLASAGIFGVALGFGAQTLVKDVISGIGIVMEDQFGVGDTVTIGAQTGTVQTIGLRVTRLQDVTGQIWYIRNGEITALGNRTQGWSIGKVELPLPLEADPIAVLTQLREVSAKLDTDPQWRPQMMEPPLVLGLTSFDAVAATYTIQLKCPATKQGDVERELRARALHALQQAGIPVGIHPGALAAGHPSTGVGGPISR